MAPIASYVRLFDLSPPVRRILTHSLLFGLAFSISDLLFNFYLVSLGYGPATAGLMSTINKAAGMLFGVPLGLLIDRIGPQRAIVLAMLGYGGGWLLMLGASALVTLAGAQLVIGAAFLMATMAVIPLLATVTHDRERASVFGLNASATLMVGLGGSAMGGLLPAGAALLLGVGPQDTAAYRLALTVVMALALLALLPLLRPFSVVSEPDVHAAGLMVSSNGPLPTRRLLRFALAGLLLGMGGGAILPFQNLFFRDVFGLSDGAVGIVLAIAALGMGLGALMGAPVTRRVGLRRSAALLRMCAVIGMLIMLVPALIPAMLGFFLRGMFISASFPMNDALVMRHTPPRQRGMAMSLMSVLWAGGWAIASVSSGYVQIRWGFAPIILFAAAVYSLSALAIITLDLPDEDRT